MPVKKRLEWSRRAERDIYGIHDYIAADNPKAAESVIALLIKSAESLIDFPAVGHEGAESGTRELVLTKYPYTIVYRLTAAKIRIVAIMHQSRQYP